MTRTLQLVARSGDDWLAMPAEAVEAVVRVADVVPVPGAPAHVRGLAAIRSRILTLIDLPCLVGQPGARPVYMAIVSIDGHAYGISLDEVDDVMDLADAGPAPARHSAGWSLIEPHIAEAGPRVILMVDPAKIIAAATALSLAA